MPKRKTKVYIVNKAGHDFSRAEEFGELIYLSEGPINRYSLTAMYRTFHEGLKDSRKDDYILPTGYSIMTMVAAVIFSNMHGKINILLYKDGNYMPRSLMLNNTKDEEQ